jgi:hypothetical protein
VRFFRIGRFWLNASPAVKPTGLEQSYIVSGEDAEALRRYLAPHTTDWKPIAIGRRHPRGPLGLDRDPDPNRF